MSRPLRLEYPGSLWHITARGNNRQLIYSDDADRRFFLKLLGESVERFGWILTAYVLMSNHYHLVVQLVDRTLSRGMKWLNGRYASYFNSKHSRVGHLFQGRFKGILVDKEAYSLEVLRYVALNPVRANMIRTPDDYEWSSHRAILGETAAPSWLAVDDALIGFAPDRELARRNYRTFVNDGIRSPKRLWDDVVGQQYLGRPEWIDLIRERIELKPRSAEIPRAQMLQQARSLSDVMSTVARTFNLAEQSLREGRERRLDAARMLVAWIAWNDARLTGREIAAGLHLRSSSNVSRLVRTCERELESNELLRHAAARCRSTPCGTEGQRQT